jgi:NAD(P)-dependent dehydrogenase (short-subunit alcohol dehydrogenase family)
MGLLDGKVALVTGGDSGIGRAVGLAYAREGAKVVIVDQHPAKNAGVVQEIEAAGGQALYVQTVVSDAKACAAMVAATVKKYGRLDIACNNAGIGGDVGPTADYGIDAWGRVIGVNLSGVFYCLKYELPELLKVKGVAVNMASILGQVAFAGSPAYVAAKHGVVAMSHTINMEECVLHAQLVLRGTIGQITFPCDKGRVSNRFRTVIPKGIIAVKKIYKGVPLWLP